MLILALASGCSTWPEQGKGGWAEEYHPDNETNSETWYASAPMHIANEYEHIQMKLDWLKVRGINKCMPAQVYQAEMLSNRIKRMLAAEMYSDAQADLRIFYHQLNLLQNHFERVLKITGCALANNEAKSDDSLKLIKQIKSLLNSDNQFAFDSFEVTPKYMTRLTQAADLLKLVPQIELLLVGHTDKKGLDTDNYELAFKRAEKVKHWLTLYGVNPSKITTVTQGSLSPYSESDNNPDSRHSDRRVNAYILNADSEIDAETQSKPLTSWTDELSKERKDGKN
jgi:outer membrane protein OmpA-like peptidoglycan-associated protein